MSALLDKNSIDSIFEFIFSYTKSDADKDNSTFDFTLRSVFNTQLPKEIQDQLKIIFERVQNYNFSLEESLNSFCINFETKKEVLIAIYQILLRYSSEDGMLSKFDSKRLKLIFDTFEITDEDLLQFNDSEKLIIKTFILNSKLAKKSCLSQMYEILKCSPDANDSEIKKNYYALAKKFHPDTSSDKKESCNDFQKIQNAYEVICQSRMTN